MLTSEIAVARRGAASAAVLTAGLAVARLLLDRTGVVWLVLAATAAGFGATWLLARRGKPIANAMLPLVGWCGVTAMAAASDGLMSEALFWAPFIPLVAVLTVGLRRSLAYGLLAAASVGGLLVAHLAGAFGTAAGPQRLALQATGALGAVAFGQVLGWATGRFRKDALTRIESGERRFRTMVETSSDIVFAYDIDDGRFTWLSATGVAALGYDVAAEDLNELARKLAPHEDFEALRRSFAGLAERPTETLVLVHEFVTRDGQTRQIQSRTRFAGGTKHREALGVAYDVTELKTLEASLRTDALRLQALVANLDAGVAVTDDAARLVVINQRLCDFFGVAGDPAQMTGKDTWALIASGRNTPRDHAAFRRRILDLVRGRKMVLAEEVELGDGRLFERAFVPLEIGGVISGHLWSYHDVTSRARREREAIELVETDPVTGVSSRHQFRTELARAVTDGEPFCVMFLDLDDFKPVNDVLGHAAGDATLVAVGAAIRATARGTDVVARVGGDEFAILLRGVKRESVAHQIATKVIAAVSTPIVVPGGTAKVGASVGAAFFPRDASTADEVVACADRAMYEAKRDRKGSFRCVAPLPDGDGPPSSSSPS